MLYVSFFFFNDTATTEIYTLSLHDALPICARRASALGQADGDHLEDAGCDARSEEHTFELQSPCNLVCRLLLEKKNQRPRLARHVGVRQGDPHDLRLVRRRLVY